MKNIVVLVCFSILMVFSCSDPITENEYNFVINFQQGHFPDASYTGAADTYIYEATPTTNFGGNTDFFVGYSGGSNRTLIRFAVYGYMPSNATVKKATLTLSVSNVFVTGSAINAHELTAAFTEGASTWNTSNSQFNAAVVGSSTIAMGAETFTIDLSPSVV